MIVPEHEQLYPDKRLDRRLEELVLDDGRPPIVNSTENAHFAKRATSADIIAMVAAAQRSTGIKTVDPRYFVGTAAHEGAINEWDTERATSSSPRGFVSVGCYQIGEEEAQRYGFTLIDMLDFEKSTICMVRLAEDNRRTIASAAIIAQQSNRRPYTPDYTDDRGRLWLGGALRAYLAIAHNHGLGFAKKSIATYGLDWEAYKRRNASSDNIVLHHYGEDCVTGGPSWPLEADA